MPDYLTFKLTLDELDLIHHALAAKALTDIKAKNSAPVADLLGQLVAQLESQLPNPHPDALERVKERFS